MRVIYLHHSPGPIPRRRGIGFLVKSKGIFKLMEEITGAIRLAAESSDLFTVSVNGNIVKLDSTYKDRAFRYTI